MSSLPLSWASCRLGDVVDYGSAIKAEPSEIPPNSWVLELEDIEKDTSRLLTRATFAERKSKSTKNRFSSGDVLYGKLRPYLNKVLRAPEDGYCSTEILPLSPNEALNGDFLFYWLRGAAFLAYVNEVSHGLNMPRLGTEAGKKAPFRLPPRSEQGRIAAKLDRLFPRLEACRASLESASALLKRFRQAVLEAGVSGELTAEWRENPSAPGIKAADELSGKIASRRERAAETNVRFKEPAEPDLSEWNRQVPPTWTVSSVSQFSECLDHLRVPVKREARAKTEGRYPYFGANGIVDRVDEYLFDDELVLVTEDETFYGRQKPIAFRSSGKCWVNNHAHVLRPGGKVEADYLCYSLMHYRVEPWLTGTSGRAKLTQAALNALPIALPPSPEMAEIVRRVEALLTFADSLEARIEAARAQVERLTPALLAKAFRGELVPQDPAEGTGAELLARIRAGRGGAAPPKRRGRPSGGQRQT